MTITSFATLKTTIADFLNRADLTAIVPVWVQFAEADISRRLRTWQMETRATLTLSGEYMDLPADWVETIRVEYNDTTGRRLTHVAPSYIASAGTLADEPRVFTTVGDQLRFWPAPSSGTADLLYYAKIPALSDAAPSNWLLSAAPEVYLYGALVHSAPYLQEDARVQSWGGLYEAAINSVQRASDRAAWTTGMRA